MERSNRHDRYIGTLGGGVTRRQYAINDAGYITGASQTRGMGPMLDDPRVYLSAAVSAVSAVNQCVDLGVLGGLFQLWHGHQQLQPRRRLFHDQNQRRSAFMHSCMMVISMIDLGIARLKTGEQIPDGECSPGC